MHKACNLIYIVFIKVEFMRQFHEAVFCGAAESVVSELTFNSSEVD